MMVLCLPCLKKKSMKIQEELEKKRGDDRRREEEKKTKGRQAEVTQMNKLEMKKKVKTKSCEVSGRWSARQRREGRPEKRVKNTGGNGEKDKTKEKKTVTTPTKRKERKREKNGDLRMARGWVEGESEDDGHHRVHKTRLRRTERQRLKTEQMKTACMCAWFSSPKGAIRTCAGKRAKVLFCSFTREVQGGSKTVTRRGRHSKAKRRSGQEEKKAGRERPLSSDRRATASSRKTARASGVRTPRRRSPQTSAELTEDSRPRGNKGSACKPVRFSLPFSSFHLCLLFLRFLPLSRPPVAALWSEKSRDS
uniref:Uncharacterized protein n=1 Tax=Toxoplasma gondii TgCATBr9 TaxID=943120 RepID=A0A2T6IEE1_TOXGO|nr:hypothetical protein TGBR9_384980 [Toxoplasma gondii TgCATBr9]